MEILMVSRYKRNHNINGFNSLSIRLKESNEKIDFVDFIEVDGKIFVEMDINRIPLRNVAVEDPETTYTLKAVKKTKLSSKVCKILAETDNYIIVRDM